MKAEPADLPIQIDKRRVAAFCRERGIRRLSVFGSVVREDFDPERSDVDVLAEFEDGALEGVGIHFYGYGEELSQIVGRKVDLCVNLDSRIRRRVEGQLTTIYERA